MSHPTQALVRLDHLQSNLSWARKRAGKAEVIPVVKSNAYGHGLAPVARALADFGAKKLAVAHVSEGAALRRAGIETPILVMGSIMVNQLEAALDHGLTPTICRREQFEALESILHAKGGKAKVHLKFDTGMGRVGVPVEDAADFLRSLESRRRVEVEGIYSHFACADEPEHPMNSKQKNRFGAVLEMAEKCGLGFAQRHLSNSAGLLNFPDSNHDAVRIGIALYGLSPNGSPLPDEIKPVMRVCSRLCFTKKLRRGTPVSYGATWKTPSENNVGAVPIGYGDGFSRKFSSAADVFEIGGKRYPVAGRVCMDLTLVDLGEDRRPVGEAVHVFGWGGSIRAEDHARILGTIPYEVVTSISERVERVFV